MKIVYRSGLAFSLEKYSWPSICRYVEFQRDNILQPILRLPFVCLFTKVSV